MQILAGFVTSLIMSYYAALLVRMASEPVMDMESADHVQKTPRRRKCKNHLAQLAEMFPDVTYHVAATYGSSEDQIYVMEVKVGEKVQVCISVV